MLLSACAGCLVPENECGKHQQLNGTHVLTCVCEDGYVPAEDGQGCVACGDYEVAKGDVCECEDGYGRSAAGKPCEVTMLGAACADDSACVAPYDHCRQEESDGYCTRADCTDDSECQEQWTCTVDGESSYCRRPPTGLGEPCMTSADCEGYEATYCESFQAKTCMVSGCASGESVCHADWACCDLSSVLGVSLCLPPDALDSSGECPAGAGKPVTP